MNQMKEQFAELLETENKEEAVKYALSLLESQKTDIVELYSKILTPALNDMKCLLQDKRICIWKEHVRTAIVRTIVEASYPYVLKKRDQMQYQKKGIAIVMCPPEEYHDLGARMVADYFTVCGYQAIFVGSNTPYEDFRNAIDVIHPEIIAISVSNYYNLVVTRKIIKEIKESLKNPVKIVVGGSAFMEKEEHVKTVGADYYAKDFTDIEQFAQKGGAI